MKAFVFDLDNTLYDRYGTIEKFFESAWDKVRPWINPAYGLERAKLHLCHTESLFIFEDGWRSWYDHLVTENFFNADNTPSYEDFSSFLKWGFSNYACNFPFTNYTLVKLKAAGYKLGILTNASDKVFQRRKLELLGISHFFDVIVISGELAEEHTGKIDDPRYYKPEPLPFILTAEKLGVKPEELYYVGDNPKADVTGARNGGCVPVWIRSRSPWILDNSLMPELCFDSIEGLLTLI